MKRYVRATELTTDEIAEMLRTKYCITGIYKTRRGKEYNYNITPSGRVEVWYDYLHYDGVSRNHMKSKYLYTVPKEMQNYLIYKYGEQLNELDITLRF